MSQVMSFLKMNLYVLYSYTEIYSGETDSRKGVCVFKCIIKKR